jgi:hypothetical protein
VQESPTWRTRHLAAVKCSSGPATAKSGRITPPRQRMPQPPPLHRKRRQRTPDLLLRASAHTATPGERQPVASVEAEPEREHEQDSRRRHGARARCNRRQHHGGGARHRRSSGSRQAAVLLATRVVQSPPSLMTADHRSGGDVGTARDAPTVAGTGSPIHKAATPPGSGRRKPRDRSSSPSGCPVSQALPRSSSLHPTDAAGMAQSEAAPMLQPAGPICPFAARPGCPWPTRRSAK